MWRQANPLVLSFVFVDGDCKLLMVKSYSTDERFEHVCGNGPVMVYYTRRLPILNADKSSTFEPDAGFDRRWIGGGLRCEKCWTVHFTSGKYDILIIFRIGEL